MNHILCFSSAVFFIEEFLYPFNRCFSFRPLYRRYSHWASILPTETSTLEMLARLAGDPFYASASWTEPALLGLEARADKKRGMLSLLSARCLKAPRIS